MSKWNDTLEFLIELIEGMVQEEGFKTKRFSEDNYLGTTAYDCLILKDAKGKEYKISFDESLEPKERYSTDFESTNYIKD